MIHIPQNTTSPRWQYIATAIIAIIAIVGALSVISQEQIGQSNISFQTASVNEHSTSLRDLATREYEQASSITLSRPREIDN